MIVKYRKYQFKTIRKMFGNKKRISSELKNLVFCAILTYLCGMNLKKPLMKKIYSDHYADCRPVSDCKSAGRNNPRG